MKRLLFVLALIAFPAIAQNFTGIVIQPILTQATDYTNVTSPELTIGYVTGGNQAIISGRRRGIRVVCTTACYISVATPATTASTATGIYLPAAVPFIMSTPGNRIVKVTGTTAGTISVTEF